MNTTGMDFEGAQVMVVVVAMTAEDEANGLATEYGRGVEAYYDNDVRVTIAVVQTDYIFATPHVMNVMLFDENGVVSIAGDKTLQRELEGALTMTHEGMGI